MLLGFTDSRFYPLKAKPSPSKEIMACWRFGGRSAFFSNEVFVSYGMHIV